MRNSIKALAALLLVTIAGCGQPAAPANTTVQPTAVSPAGTEPAAPPPAAPEPASPVPVTPAQQWTMPDLTGRNLQQAQDDMQKLTGNPVFITRSHDATGKKRNQVVDSNWKVCSQNVAPGGQVTDRSTVDFGAVKLEEPCP